MLTRRLAARAAVAACPLVACAVMVRHAGEAPAIGAVLATMFAAVVVVVVYRARRQSAQR